MKILVFAYDSAWNELIQGNTSIEWIRAETVDSFKDFDHIDGYFNLDEIIFESDYSLFKKPIFINSVIHPLHNFSLKEKGIRINGWNGFLKRPIWEVSGNITNEITDMLNAMNKKIITSPDEPGFISARIIAMIINEAYFALEDHVSSKNEIDIAMKLGTNYPYGPFEWSKIIGINNIYALLKFLSKTDSRYKPAALMQDEIMKLK